MKLFEMIADYWIKQDNASRAHELEIKRLEFQREESLNHCDSCDALKLELASVKEERDKLLDHIINPVIKQEVKVEGKFNPIQSSRHIPFSVRRNALEAEDRDTAKKLKENELAAVAAGETVSNEPLLPLTIEQLEVELGVGDDLKKEA